MAQTGGGPWKGSSKGPTFRLGQVIALMLLSGAIASAVTWGMLAGPNSVSIRRFDISAPDADADTDMRADAEQQAHPPQRLSTN